MKKLKYLPAMLMLVLCVGILAIGIYAIQPSKNTISGTITVNASSAEIGIQVYHTAVHADNLIKEYESVRSGVDIPLTHEALDYTMENVNSLDQVNETPKKVIIKITNKSGKDLGGYFFNPDSTLVDGKATFANIDEDVTLDGKGKNADGEEVTENGLLKATFSGYTQIPAKDPADETQNGSAEIEISFELLKFVSYDMTIDLSKFNIQLNIEDFQKPLTMKANTMYGGVNLKNVDASVKVELFEDGVDTAVQKFDSTSSNISLNDIKLDFDTTGKTDVKQVEPIIYRLRVTNLSAKELGVYFFNEGTEELLESNGDTPSGLAKIGNIATASQINVESTENKAADVYLSDYAYVAPNSDTKYNYIDMKIYVFLSNLSEASNLNPFTFNINIEEYKSNTGKISVNYDTGDMPEAYYFSGSFMKVATVNTSIDDGAFASHWGGRSGTYMVMPTTVTSVSDGNGSTLVHMAIPRSATSVTLTSGNNITEITFEEGLTTIPAMEHVKVSQIIIPSTVTTIVANAFSGCTSLETIYGQISGDGYEFNNGEVKITKSSALSIAYIANYVEVEGNFSIPGCAFENNTFIRTVKLFNGITGIGPDCFSNCTNLRSIYFANTVNDLSGYSNFYNCPNLETITFEQGDYKEFDLKVFLDGFVLNRGTDSEETCTNGTTPFIRSNLRENVYTREA